MKLSFFGSIRARLRSGFDLALDCDELIRLWGDEAHERAGRLSQAEDFGFASKSNPGHWARVQREIERRDGRARPEPKLNIAA